MEATTRELSSIVSQYAALISKIPDAEFSNKPLPDKWSKKEVLGHLIDSAQNNLRRFVCGQYEASPSKITYDQDFWVKAADYQNRPSKDVIDLWTLLNGQICAVLASMPSVNYGKTSDTGKNEANLHSLKWLAEDYVKHMKHHLNQVIPGSFDIVYT